MTDRFRVAPAKQNAALWQKHFCTFRHLRNEEQIDNVPQIWVNATLGCYFLSSAAFDWPPVLRQPFCCSCANKRNPSQHHLDACRCVALHSSDMYTTVRLRKLEYVQEHGALGFTALYVLATNIEEVICCIFWMLSHNNWMYAQCQSDRIGSLNCPGS